MATAANYRSTDKGRFRAVLFAPALSRATIRATLPGWQGLRDYSETWPRPQRLADATGPRCWAYWSRSYDETRDAGNGTDVWRRGRLEIVFQGQETMADADFEALFEIFAAELDSASDPGALAFEAGNLEPRPSSYPTQVGEWEFYSG